MEEDFVVLALIPGGNDINYETDTAPISVYLSTPGHMNQVLTRANERGQNPLAFKIFRISYLELYNYFVTLDLGSEFISGGQTPGKVYSGIPRDTFYKIIKGHSSLEKLLDTSE